MPIPIGSGVLIEELTVTSLIHTISVNTPGILKVKILVDGKKRDSLLATRIFLLTTTFLR
ncbi:MAG: hypothetical protein WCC22_06215 [Terriglobales bacterium]